MRAASSCIGAKPSHVAPVRYRPRVESVADAKSRIEEVVSAADQIGETSSSSVLSMLWDYLSYLTRSFRTAVTSFTWKVLLNNSPFPFGKIVELAGKIAVATGDGIASLISQFAQLAIALFDWMIGADLITADSDEAEAAREKDVLIEHAALARTESHGLAAIVAKGGRVVWSAARTFVGALSSMVSVITSVYDVAIDTCANAIGSSIHHLSEWALENAPEIAIDMTRFFVFLTNAAKQLAELTQRVLSVLTEKAVDMMVKFIDAVNTFFGFTTTQLGNFLREVLRPLITAKQRIVALTAAVKDNALVKGIFAGHDALKATNRLVDWTIKLISGGASSIAMQMLFTGISNGVRRSVTMIFHQKLTERAANLLPGLFTVEQRIAMIEMLQSTTGYQYLNNETRGRADRQIKATRELMADIEQSTRRKIEEGEIGALMNNTLRATWQSSRGLTRELFGRELSADDKSNSMEQAADLMFTTPGRVTSLVELEAALVQTHHLIVQGIQKHYQPKVASAAEGLDFDQQDAAANGDGSQLSSPPLYLGVMTDTWHEFMEDYSHEYYGAPPKPVAENSVEGEPDVIRVAYEWVLYRQHGQNSLTTTKEIFAEILRRKFQDQTGPNQFSRSQIEAEIKAMREEPIDVAAAAVKRQYEMLTQSRALVALPMSAQLQARNAESWHTMARNITLGSAPGVMVTAGQFGITANVSGAFQSTLVAMTEMALNRNSGVFYSTWSQRLLVAKPFLMLGSVLLFIAWAATVAVNNQYGFDMTRIGHIGAIEESRIINEKDPNIQKMLKVFHVMENENLMKHMQEKAPSVYAKLNAWKNRYWFSPSKTYSAISGIAVSFKNALADKESAPKIVDADIKKMVDEIKTFDMNSVVSKVEKKGTDDKVGTWTSIKENTVGRAARFFGYSKFTFHNTPQAIGEKLMSYALDGFLWFAVPVILVSLAIDMLIVHMERRQEMPPEYRVSGESGYTEVLKKHAVYGFQIGQLGIALYKYQSSEMITGANTLFQFVTGSGRAIFGLGGAAFAVYSGDPATATSLALGAGTGFLSNLVTTANVASGAEQGMLAT